MSRIANSTLRPKEPKNRFSFLTFARADFRIVDFFFENSPFSPILNNPLGISALQIRQMQIVVIMIAFSKAKTSHGMIFALYRAKKKSIELFVTAHSDV